MTNQVPISTTVSLIVERIVTAIHPVRIILFGSVAREAVYREGAIDLLVVGSRGIHRRRTAQQLYRQLAGLGVAFTILVARSDDLERHRDNHGLIYRTILEEGIELYAA